MALNIKDGETDRLVRQLAEATGESITAAVATAVRERLERVRLEDRGDRRLRELREIAERTARLPVLDDRPAEAILGYDERGLPR